MMHIETIRRQGKIFALLPMKDLKKLLLDTEVLADIRAYDVAKARLESGEDELIPLDLVERRIAGENRVKLWREHRRLTQEKLASTSGVSRVMIAAVETGHKRGSIATLKKLAAALNVDLDQLI
jgi:DNA-binding XRE family transcriptional regulator